MFGPHLRRGGKIFVVVSGGGHTHVMHLTDHSTSFGQLQKSLKSFESLNISKKVLDHHEHYHIYLGYYNNYRVGWRHVKGHPDKLFLTWCKVIEKKLL